MSQILTARRLLTAEGVLDDPQIIVEQGRIRAIEPGTASAGTQTLVPGFFDIHVHGAVRRDVMEGTSDALGAIAAYLLTQGITHFLPTTVTASVDATLHALEGTARYIEAAQKAPATDQAIPLGIHLEGPFLSQIKRGVHPPAQLLEANVELFDRMQQAAQGHIRLMTIAPEIPGALDLIRHASQQGVRISLGHTNATAAETLASIDAGATSATHTFNAMRALDHREPGVLGTVLDDERLYAELICDGIHVAPPLVRLWYRMKGNDRSILVSDGMSATGMPDGTYQLGAISVEVVDGCCRANGVLAGSVLSLNRAIANMQSFTGAPLCDAARLASINPARMLGLQDAILPRVGGLVALNAFSEDGHLEGTYFGERWIPA
jgi:N-acetylglucosamine-6-phosphate deacetylase